MSKDKKDDVYLGTSVFTIRLDEDLEMPELGTWIETPDFKMLVTEVDIANRTVTLVSPVDKSSHKLVDKYNKLAEQSVGDIGEILYNSFSSGMTKNVGWKNMTEEGKEEYLETSIEILKLLKERGLLRFFNKVL